MAYLVRLEYYHVWHIDSANSAIGCIAMLACLIGLGGYQANFIQLGLDQLLSAPSEDLALFVHWAIWAYNLGSTVIATVWPSFICSKSKITAKIILTSVPLFLVAFFMLVLIISCWKRHWFSNEIRQQNPCRMILKVLNFARKHKYPLQRSAFTFSDDEKPSRLDFAKVKYGGPFTTVYHDTKPYGGPEVH